MPRKTKKAKPHIYVFCEGESEQAYTDFLKEHLRYLHKSIEDGSNCLGFHMWTFIDCWSWINAYKNRYGFYRLDLETQERTVKKSGLWFKELIDNNGF